MGCCNCREIDSHHGNSIPKYDSRRDEYLNTRQSQIKENELNCEKENKKTKAVEKLSTVNQSEFDTKVKNYDVSTTNFNNNFETSNILQKETDNFCGPKSFIETRNAATFSENIFITKEYSSSFMEKKPTRTKIHQEYMTQPNKTSNPIKTSDKDINDFTFKVEIAKKKSMNSSIVINSEEKDDNINDFNLKNNAELGYKHLNGERVLLKQSLRKNKTPKFFLSPKKAVSRQEVGLRFFEYSAADPNAEKNSFLSINKDTFHKYHFLFSDVEGASNKSMKAYEKRFSNSKNISQFEEADLSNVQKFGTVYSSSKLNTSNVLNTDTDLNNRILSSIKRKNTLLAEQPVKEMKL